METDNGRELLWTFGYQEDEDLPDAQQLNGRINRLVQLEMEILKAYMVRTVRVDERNLVAWDPRCLAWYVFLLFFFCFDAKLILVKAVVQTYSYALQPLLRRPRNRVSNLVPTASCLFIAPKLIGQPSKIIITQFMKVFRNAI
jgi:hypothetical protein